METQTHSLKNSIENSDVYNQLTIIKQGADELLIEDEFIQKLNESIRNHQPLRIKLGLDPTAADLHLGHTVVLNKLRQLQDLGHTVIFLIGDFTALIGDPSGRNHTRPALSKQQIIENAHTYFAQAALILDTEKTQIHYNSEWLKDLGTEGLIRLAASYTVARILEREDFTHRFKNKMPIAVHEFLYPLMQGYDSVALEADLEIGGTDQKFNLLVGRELQKQSGKKAQCILTMPLLVGLDGVQKMSKSLGNAIAITENPYDMFGKLMRISDELMWRYYELLSFSTKEQLQKLKQEVAQGRNPREIKVLLAQEIVQRFHNSAQAQAALERFNQQAKGEVPDQIPEVVLYSAPLLIRQLLKQAGLLASASEAVRMIEQRGVKIDGTIISDKALLLEAGIYLIQVGKRNYARIILKKSVNS